MFLLSELGMTEVGSHPRFLALERSASDALASLLETYFETRGVFQVKENRCPLYFLLGYPYAYRMQRRSATLPARMEVPEKWNLGLFPLMYSDKKKPLCCASLLSSPTSSAIREAAVKHQKCEIQQQAASTQGKASPRPNSFRR